eukprot:CAMPEP_0116059322 /NCGR_PEP_ID=MMETSP0322-20121206/5722_1 /TAXON_ID=163516 /ORGANISM="Leptocylindrus danicus var. apora, Strain B651" /LENGTH=406 /DNA_ID=CAMNT_0003543671 /DNA_START=84 /DNA_END=1304 /DNA_ORIENTATION=-
MTDTDYQDKRTLREVASEACKCIDVGVAVLPKLLLNEDVYASTVRSEFNAIVVEHHMKWAPLCQDLPGPIEEGTESTRVGRYDFHHCDQIVDFGLRHGMKVKGHVLVWHVTTPSWVQNMTAEELSEQIRRHIFTTMGHFRGRIKYWDVVNEALAPDGSLANNIFLEKLGPGYIEQCFRWAHEADPNAFLIYNDNKVEGCGLGDHSRKADAFYELLKNLKAKNTPVHGAGIQAHFNAAGVGLQRPPTPIAVKRQIRRLGDLGLRVNISEMDVRISKLPMDENMRTNAQCDIYRDIVSAALSESSFDGIWLWGFTDAHTWIKHFYYDGDQPLLFDKDFKKKKSYYAFRDALGTLSVGGIVGGKQKLFQRNDELEPWGKLWMQPEPNFVSDKSSKILASGDSNPDWLQR